MGDGCVDERESITRHPLHFPHPTPSASFSSVCQWGEEEEGWRRGGGVINADWLIALETDWSCTRIVLKQWSVPDWHFPPSPPLLPYFTSSSFSLLSLSLYPPLSLYLFAAFLPSPVPERGGSVAASQPHTPARHRAVSSLLCYCWCGCFKATSRIALYFTLDVACHPQNGVPRTQLVFPFVLLFWCNTFARSRQKSPFLKTGRRMTSQKA